MSKIPIHHTFGPMVTAQQLWQAFFLQFAVWKWKNGQGRERLRETLEETYSGTCALYDTGRAALLSCLRALELKPGEEVIIQGFTCVVVPNAISAAGGTPVYVDIDEDTLNLNAEEVERHITHRTRAVICQHTFGIPADVKRLRELCHEHDLALIEDCAHIVAPEADTDMCKTGDVLIFSFGRDKAVSGVTGGAAVTKHELLAKRMAAAEDEASHLSFWNILQLIDYPLRYKFAKSIWWTRIAKAYLKFISMLKWLPPVLSSDEKKGYARMDIHKMPNACCLLALEQWRRRGVINAHRKKLSLRYEKAAETYGWQRIAGFQRSPAPQKYSVYTERADEIRATMKKKEIYLDDGWCMAVVNPRSSDAEGADYVAGSCPVAERVSQRILSLPTHPTMNDAQADYLIQVLSTLL